MTDTMTTIMNDAVEAVNGKPPVSLVDYAESPTRAGVAATTGLSRLDDAIGGGMHPGELALMAGVQGAGMTNLMINMMHASALSGQYNLLISLEMPARPLQERMLAIAAHMRASRFRECRSVSAMTMDEQNRLEAARTSDIAPRVSLQDYSARACTAGTLAGAVSRWLESLERLGVRDKAGYVYIDKLEFIEVDDLPPRRSNLDAGVVDSTVSRLKRGIAADLGVRVCLSMHAHHLAENVAVLEPRHLKYSTRVHDSADFCVGLADVGSGTYREIDDYSLEPLKAAGVASDDIVQKVVSLFKTRIGHTTAFKLYQGPTLRLYDAMADCRAALAGLPAAEPLTVS